MESVELRSRVYRGETKIGKIKYLYKKQRYRSIDRKHPPPEYSKEEFINFCSMSKKFNTLFKMWRISEYNKWLAPSIDRLDDYKGYSFDNIRIVTWMENDMKYKKDLKLRVNKKVLKPVLQICADTNIVVGRFDSAKDAFYELGVDNSHIRKCCIGKLKTTGGYGWKYE